MCRSLEDGGRRCDAECHPSHNAAWYAAKRERRREQYLALHPSKGGHGRKPLPADAGPPKRRPSKLNLGAPAGMMVDLSRGLGLGEVPEGHPTDAAREAANEVIRSRRAVKVKPVVTAAEPTVVTPTPFTPPAAPTTFPVTVTRIQPKTPASSAAAAVGVLELAALTKAEAHEAAALEDFRDASAGDPTKDVRPMAERRANPDGNPDANHPDGPAWAARHAKAKAKLEAAKVLTEKARTVHQASMAATWAAEAEAADAEAASMAAWRARRQAERDAATA